MSDLPIIDTPQGARRLGCLVPTAFPTAGYPLFADAGLAEIYTLDEVRVTVRQPFGTRSVHGRRERFAGTRYIRNQRSYGSCNGWSTAGVLSRLRELNGQPYVCLSGADAYSQMNGNQDNGSVLADGLKVALANGVAPEELVPWDHVFDRQISAAAKAARARFKGFAAYAVDTQEELASALLVGFLAVVAVHVTDPFMRQDGDGVNLAGNGPGNHSVLVQDLWVGTDGTIQFDMGNSWDTSFCSGGYTKLTWDRHFRETVRNHRFWVLASTSEDQQDDDSPPEIKS